MSQRLHLNIFQQLTLHSKYISHRHLYMYENMKRDIKHISRPSIQTRSNLKKRKIENDIMNLSQLNVETI